MLIALRGLGLRSLTHEAAVLRSLIPEENPVSTLCAIGATGIFALIAMQTSSFMSMPTYALLRSGADFGPFTLQGGEIWRLLSYGALHGSAIHLLFNVYVLLALGTELEDRIGSGAYALILAGGVISGGLASALGTPAPSVGMSGGLLAVMAAYAMMLHMDAQSSSMARRNQLLFWIGFIFVLGLIGDISNMANFDNAAHAGGAAFGAGAGFLLKRRRERFPRWLRWLGPALLVIMTLIPLGLQLQYRQVPLDNGSSAGERERHRLQAWDPCKADILAAKWDDAIHSCERYRQATLLYSAGHKMMMLLHAAQGNTFQATRLHRLLAALGEPAELPGSAEAARALAEQQVYILDQTRFR